MQALICWVGVAEDQGGLSKCPVLTKTVNPLGSSPAGLDHVFQGFVCIIVSHGRIISDCLLMFEIERCVL